jgi:hypothetical protein
MTEYYKVDSQPYGLSYGEWTQNGGNGHTQYHEMSIPLMTVLVINARRTRMDLYGFWLELMEKVY